MKDSQMLGTLLSYYYLYSLPIFGGKLPFDACIVEAETRVESTTAPKMICTVLPTKRLLVLRRWCTDINTGIHQNRTRVSADAA